MSVKLAINGEEIELLLKDSTFLFHSPCADGHAALAAIFSAFPPEIQGRILAMIAANEGKTPDWNHLDMPTPREFIEADLPILYGTHPRYAPDRDVVAGRHVVIVDLSFDQAKLATIAERAASVIVLDHHTTSEYLPALLTQEDKPAWADKMKHHIRMDWCGAELAWQAFRHTVEFPPLLDYIAAADLWLWDERVEKSREVHIALQVEGTIKSLAKLVSALEMTDKDISRLQDTGAVCIKMKDMQIRETCLRTKVAKLYIGKAPPTLDGGFGTDKEVLTVQVASTNTHVSEVGHWLCEKPINDAGDLPDCAAIIMVGLNSTRVSLRSSATSTLRLGHIAQALSGTLNGGGHDHAAGFGFHGTDIKAFLSPL